MAKVLERNEANRPPPTVLLNYPLFDYLPRQNESRFARKILFETANDR